MFSVIIIKKKVLVKQDSVHFGGQDEIGNPSTAGVGFKYDSSFESESYLFSDRQATGLKIKGIKGTHSFTTLFIFFRCFGY